LTELLGLTLAHGSTGVTLGLSFPLIPISSSADYEHFLDINTFYTSGIGSIVMNGGEKWYYLQNDSLPLWSSYLMSMEVLQTTA